jgi:hypothetical protein
LIPEHIVLDKVDFWFQDEARIGQQNTITRLWSMKGCRPKAVKQQQFDYAYLFGAVCPATGETEALIAPYVDKNIMTNHLEQISAKTKTGRHAVVIMDGPGWRSSRMASSVIGGRYQQFEYPKVAPVFTGAKLNRASVELASPTSFSESMF